jgi:hypothetical protein
MRITKRILMMLPALLIAMASMAQVTTSTISGTVSSKGQGLEGASVKAVHVPSGSTYATVSKKGGTFNLLGLRAGGPYTVTIVYVGLKTFVEEGFSVPLGATYDINAEMTDATTELSAVVVLGTKRRSAVDKIGTSTNIGQLQLNTLPTISRSITDFTRLTPQASGNSFAGRDGKMNNVTVDGANLNNNFGLSTDALPGGGNPISLDAFQEISVNIAPYDVKQSGFTGAAINAITKSGTNTFHGSAYTVFRNQSYNGLNVAGNKLATPATTSNKIYGATIGGPIIKNKLFFFVTGESEVGSAPGVTFSPKGGSGNGTTSNVPIDSLSKFANYLSSKYGYDAGAYDNFGAFETKNYKILAKIDWNISTQHKLTAKFSDFKNTGYNPPSGSGGINGANSQSAIVSYIGSYRFGAQAMGFTNSFYKTVDKVRSYSLELNSNFNGKFSNQFITTLTKIASTKGHDGGAFPFIDILGLTTGSKVNYMSAGNEPFNGNNNDVINDVFNITDNVTYFAGKHTITAGVTYEYQRVGNMFMPGSQGYYVYGSLDDFINNRAPKLFSINYSLVPGQDAVYSANLKIGQIGGYIQDEFNINPRFKLTYGLRIDAPVYPEQPLNNPAIASLTFADRNGNPAQYSTGRWPQATRYFAPRASFRWDIHGDKTQILRGGTGIFTGRVPYVLLTNMPSTSAMYTFGSLVTATSDLGNFLFNPDPHAYNPFFNSSLNPTLFPKTVGSVAPGTFAVLDKNFKFPQVWRSNIAVDQQLSNGWSYSLEALFTQSLNDPIMRNANQKAPDATITLAPGITRPYYSSNSNAVRRINAAITNATVLENTNKNYSFSVTAAVSKAFTKGFYGSIAYTYSVASDVTANPGSQAASIWAGNANVGTQNDLESYNSAFAVPHRIVASLSYRVEYLQHLASTFSFFYEGATQGRYTYQYANDLNNDGNTADLMYIPRSTAEMNFTAKAASGTTPAFSAADQVAAFEKFITGDPYLSKHRGENAQRNGALYPFYHRVDFNFLQDIFTNVGKYKNTLQFNLTVVNFLNLLNNNWGIRKSYVVNNPLTSTVTAGVPSYTLATYTPQGATVSQLVDRTFVNVNSTSTTWGIQMGFKYLF